MTNTTQKNEGTSIKSLSDKVEVLTLAAIGEHLGRHGRYMPFLLNALDDLIEKDPRYAQAFINGLILRFDCDPLSNIPYRTMAEWQRAAKRWAAHGTKVVHDEDVTKMLYNQRYVAGGRAIGKTMVELFAPHEGRPRGSAMTRHALEALHR